MSEIAMRFIAQAREHPDWCATEHAHALGVSREYVRQLKNKLGLALQNKRGWRNGQPPAGPRYALCVECGEPTGGYGRQRHRACVPNRYGTPARSREYQRQWMRAYYAKRRAARPAEGGTI